MGLKSGTGELDLESDDEAAEGEKVSGSDSDGTPPSKNSATERPFDIDDLPYLVQRQMQGASVNSDRTKQLLLEVRPFVKEGEADFIVKLQQLVDGPIYKADAREAAMVVAQENPELIAEKLREWGIEHLNG